MLKWKPPTSPHGLIQELLWPDEWRILVSCLLLNMTTRKQVDRVIDKLFLKYPNADSLAIATDGDLYDIVKSLGLANKRVKTLKRFSKEYISKDWQSPIELYGCGKYADDAWHIFCSGEWNEVNPQDHALNNYHGWLKENATMLLGDKDA